MNNKDDYRAFVKSIIDGEKEGIIESLPHLNDKEKAIGNLFMQRLMGNNTVSVLGMSYFPTLAGGGYNRYFVKFIRNKKFCQVLYTKNSILEYNTIAVLKFPSNPYFGNPPIMSSWVSIKGIDVKRAIDLTQKYFHPVEEW